MTHWHKSNVEVKHKWTEVNIIFLWWSFHHGRHLCWKPKGIVWWLSVCLRTWFLARKKTDDSVKFLQWWLLELSFNSRCSLCGVTFRVLEGALFPNLRYTVFHGRRPGKLLLQPGPIGWVPMAGTLRSLPGHPGGGSGLPLSFHLAVYRKCRTRAGGGGGLQGTGSLWRRVGWRRDWCEVPRLPCDQNNKARCGIVREKTKHTRECCCFFGTPRLVKLFVVLKCMSLFCQSVPYHLITSPIS